MKILLTILVSISTVIAFSQSNETADPPTSFSELSSSDIPINSHKQKADPGTHTNPSNAPMSVSFYTDRTTFDADHPGLPVETWESSLIGPNQLCTGYAPLDEFTNGSCFSTGDIMPGIEVNMIPVNNDYVLLTSGYLGISYNVVGPNTFTDNMNLFFDPPVQAVGFDLLQPLTPYGFTISVYDENGDFLGSATSPATAEEFWGVSSDTPIGEILFVGDNSNGAELIGNLAFGNDAPETPIGEWAIVLGVSLILIFTIIRIKTSRA